LFLYTGQQKENNRDEGIKMSSFRNVNTAAMVEAIEFIHSAFNNPALRRLLNQLSFFLFCAVFVLTLLRINPSFLYFWLGFGVSILGEAIQLWSFSCLEKNRVLSTRGPYSLTRNPMYLGRFFLLLGFLILFENLWLVTAYMIVYMFYMVNRVKREEDVLSKIFENEYAKYCRKVNRFIPSLRGTTRWPLGFFSSKLLIENNGHLNALMVTGVYGIFFLKFFIFN
jgi:protein-S-isoprenylcysteine O-methyltransferase Ste14